MTLFKQIALVVSLIFILILFATTFGDFKRSGAFVEGQLQKTAQDMVTTLGIAISNSNSVNDRIVYETLFNAVFDSGYYSSIELVAPSGEIISRKDRQVEINDVPNWFISMVGLSPATGSTQVMQGWIPLGTLKLTLHPGYIYTSLYKNLTESFFWFSILFLFGLVVLWIVLHQLMKPLAQMKEQADAIHANQFVLQSCLPRTLELRRVVEAMNRMVSKVQAVFGEQEKTLGLYQKLLYEDELTGLGNRQYFMAELERARSDETLFYDRCAVIKINRLDYIHDNFGYEKSEAILKILANILKESVIIQDNQECFFIDKDEFALLIHETDKKTIEYLEDIFEQFKTSDLIMDFTHHISLTAGVTSVTSGEGKSDILAESDLALTQALAVGPYSIQENLLSNTALPQGKIQWRACLENSISFGQLFLVRQKVVDSNGVAIHQEVFVRLKNDDGETVSAGIFMPMANVLGLGESMDKVVFQLVRDMSEKQNTIPIAINLSISVFSHADALVEFNHLLQFFNRSSTGLCVEASHSIVERYPAMGAKIAESVRKADQLFGIDNLNIGLSLEILQTVRPSYVKVNSRTLTDMTTGDISAGFQALLTLTKTMDIRLIAVGVESQEVHDHLQQLGITTMQGNFINALEDVI